jgi:AraC family transcriptional regulator of adaptative response / DNA-3-methyladenine glycosylase II
VALGSKRGHIEVRLDARGNSLDLRIDFPEARSLNVIVERVRRLFDLRADPAQIRTALGGDPLLARRVAADPGLRVPGAWDGFELAVRAILGQQVSVKGASTLAGRIVRAFGEPAEFGGGLTHLFPRASALAGADYSSIGLPAARAEAIRRLALAVESGEIVFSGVVDPGRFGERLRHLPGIGEWTAQYIAMRALSEPDAFPASDLWLLRAAGVTSAKQLEQRAEAWRPWRAYAAMYLWQNEENANDVLHIHGKSNRAAVAGR